MSKHIGVRRKDDATKKIKAKIKVLGGYLKTGIPSNAFIPENETSFRSWADPQLGLEKIGSPNTMNEPHNQPLKEQAAELIKELVRRKHSKQSRTNMLDKLRSKNKEKDRLIRTLSSQWHTTKYELDRSQQNESRLANRNAELLEENANLTRQLRIVTGLELVRGSKGRRKS